MEVVVFSPAGVSVTSASNSHFYTVFWLLRRRKRVYKIKTHVGWRDLFFFGGGGRFTDADLFNVVTV